MKFVYSCKGNNTGKKIYNIDFSWDKVKMRRKHNNP